MTTIYADLKSGAKAMCVRCGDRAGTIGHQTSSPWAIKIDGVTHTACLYCFEQVRNGQPFDAIPIHEQME